MSDEILSSKIKESDLDFTQEVFRRGVLEGGATSNNGTSGSGGSGVVIVRLLTSDWSTITGGTQTTDGSYTVVTFQSSGTLTLAAGGGGGGATYIPKIIMS